MYPLIVLQSIRWVIHTPHTHTYDNRTSVYTCTQCTVRNIMKPEIVDQTILLIAQSFARTQTLESYMQIHIHMPEFFSKSTLITNKPRWKMENETCLLPIYVGSFEKFLLFAEQSIWLVYWSCFSYIYYHIYI